jgi:hypothetical protein
MPPREEVFVVVGNDRAETDQLVARLRERGFTGARVAPDTLLLDRTERGPARAFLWRPSAWLLECLPHLPRAGRALDVATGSGRNAVALALHGVSVWGIDLLPDALERARRLAAGASSITVAGLCAFAVVDATRSLPFRDRSLDVVMGFRYLDRALFPRLAALLVPGGFLVWETFTVEQRRYGPPHRDEYLLEQDELPALCRSAGLEPVRLHESAEPPGPALAAVLARRF